MMANIICCSVSIKIHRSCVKRSITTLSWWVYNSSDDLFSPCPFQRAFSHHRIRNARYFQLLSWSESHHQWRQYPPQVPTIQYHCWDNIYQVLYHPTREQHLNWSAQVDIVRMDIQGGETWLVLSCPLAVKDARTLSKWHQLFNTMNLPMISQLIN